MLTKELENDFLYNLQRQHPADIIELPGYEDRGYKIDLTTRTIESPEFLSIEKDHDSEIKYFVVDRYLDHKDLSTTTCIIQYTNAKGEDFVYPVPFMDTYTLKDSHKMILPWNISGSATVAAGEITYSFRFYEFEKETDEDGNIVNYKRNLIYNLNTLPAKSKILYGLDFNVDKSDQLTYDSDAYSQLYNLIMNDTNRTIYWKIID